MTGLAARAEYFIGHEVERVTNRPQNTGFMISFGTLGNINVTRPVSFRAIPGVDPTAPDVTGYTLAAVTRSISGVTLHFTKQPTAPTDKEQRMAVEIPADHTYILTLAGYETNSKEGDVRDLTIPSPPANREKPGPDKKPATAKSATRKSRKTT